MSGNRSDEENPDLFGDRREEDPSGSGVGSSPPAPLADRMRPRSWEEILGQEGLTGPGSPLRRLHEQGLPASLILWGPPGSGKTTLGLLLSDLPGAERESFSAVLSGVRDVREVVSRARARWSRRRQRTILFVDEIHRFNRAQQDAFLPHVETGRIVLIGATTENPSFSVIPALLSRCAVLVLSPLEDSDLRALGERALSDAERGLGDRPTSIDEDGWSLLLSHAGGDARRLLSTLEALVEATPPDRDAVRRPAAGWIAEVCARPLPPSVGREDHYDLASALIKSLRGSDPHASLYWLARLLEGGEDPLFLARRLIVFASEDVGLAEPGGLHHATAAASAVASVGLPEGRLALAQATLYLALCPKSDGVDRAYRKAAALARGAGPLAVPLRIRNAPTELMRRLGHGRGYRSPHEFPSHWIPESYLPEGIPPDAARIAEPGDQGREKELWAGHRRRTGGFYEATRPAEDAGS